jgi:arylsulfatase A-like enzyme
VPVFNRFDGSQPTVAKLLQQAGYHTGMIGKWHLFSDPTGFDYWNILPGQGAYHNPVFVENGQRKAYAGYVTDLITAFTLDFLKNRPKDKPFLLFCHHKAPHRPWELDAKHAGLYEDVEIPEPETLEDDYRTRSAAATEATMRVGRDLTRTDLKQDPPPGLSETQRRKWNYQRYIKDYLRCVAAMDDDIGRVLDYLKQSGLSNNTIVFYTSDNGFFLGDHGWFDKRFMYEESLRVPLIFSNPRLYPQPVKSNALVSHVDFLPTLASLFGAPRSARADWQGVDYSRLVIDPSGPPTQREIIFTFDDYQSGQATPPYPDPPNHIVSIRERRWKLAKYYDAEGKVPPQWEMYDLRTDPLERTNLAYEGFHRSPQQEREFRRLKRKLRRVQR